ncbi:MAG: hypothetical protein JXB48_13560 [Candidatus Latescibacteria bacterium]|nr:hypothetical protein [Candidatus Latescibacterota bacterium]
MKKIIHLFITVWLLLLTLCLLFVQGCSKDSITNTADIVDAPEIPPKSSFIIDFDSFPIARNTTETIKKSFLRSEMQSYKNWEWSAGNVLVWNTLLTVTLAVPVASFVESFNHDPKLQMDGTWIWPYSFIVFGQSYSAELHAKLDTEGIQWDMYITRQNVYDDFHWYTGRSNLFTTDGYWVLYKKPEDPVPILRIEWDRDMTNNSTNIKYINVIPDNPANGSYIYYSITDEIPYDAYYDIYLSESNNSTNIMWNRSTKEGRVNDVLHFENDAWHCWNTQLEDIECP